MFGGVLGNNVKELDGSLVHSRLCIAAQVWQVDFFPVGVGVGILVLVQRPCGDVVGTKGSANLVRGNALGELVRVPGCKVGCQSTAVIQVFQAVQSIDHLVLNDTVDELAIAHDPLVGVCTVSLEVSGQSKVGVQHAGSGAEACGILATVDGGAVLSKLDQHIVHFLHIGGFAQPQGIQPVRTVVQTGNAFGRVQCSGNAIQLAIAGSILHGGFAQHVQNVFHIVACIVIVSVGQITQIIAIQEFIEVFAVQHDDIRKLAGAELES